MMQTIRGTLTVVDGETYLDLSTDSGEVRVGPVTPDVPFLGIIEGVSPKTVVAPPNTRTKRRSQTQETSIAEDIGGKVQPASGAMAHAKGDVLKRGQLRIEAKFTYASSYRLELHTLHKIANECKGKEKPAVQVDFVSKETNGVIDRWIVIPYHDWKDYIAKHHK